MREVIIQQVRLDANHKPLILEEQHVPLMCSGAVSEVLEEVAPMATRGNEIMKAIHVTGCNEYHLADYEKVSIGRSMHTCDPSSHEQDVRTAITFKRNSVPKQNKQPGLAPPIRELTIFVRPSN